MRNQTYEEVTDNVLKWDGFWSAETSLSKPKHGHTAVLVSDVVYIIGGTTQLDSFRREDLRNLR